MSRQRQGAAVFSKQPRPALQPPTRQFNQFWGSFLEVRLPGRQVDYSFPSVAKIKNEYSYTSTPHIRLHCVYTDGCIFTLNSRMLGSRLVIISGHSHGVRGGWYTCVSKGKELRYSSTLSLTSALDGSGRSTPHLGRLTPRKRPVPIVQKAVGGGTKVGLGVHGETSIPGPSSP